MPHPQVKLLGVFPEDLACPLVLLRRQGAFAPKRRFADEGLASGCRGTRGLNGRRLSRDRLSSLWSAHSALPPTAVQENPGQVTSERDVGEAIECAPSTCHPTVLKVEGLNKDNRVVAKCVDGWGLYSLDAGSAFGTSCLSPRIAHRCQLVQTTAIWYVSDVHGCRDTKQVLP